MTDITTQVALGERFKQAKEAQSIRRGSHPRFKDARVRPTMRGKLKGQR